MKRSFPSVLSLLAVLVAAMPLLAQSGAGPGQCAALSSPRPIRAEGVTERAGDIFLECSFANSPTTLSGILTFYLPVAVTNAVNANGVASDALLLADSGGGYAPTGVSGVVAGQSISFYGLSLPVPAGGQLNLKVSGIRLNASQFSGAGGQPIQAYLSFNVPLTQSQVTVAYAQTSLYATVYDTGIACWGSPMPSAISLTNLFAAGTALASTRFTEAFAGALQPRGAGDSNGARLAIRYSGMPGRHPAISARFRLRQRRRRPHLGRRPRFAAGRRTVPAGQRHAAPGAGDAERQRRRWRRAHVPARGHGRHPARFRQCRAAGQRRRPGRL